MPKWTNWAATSSAHPTVRLVAQTTEELQGAVARAAEGGRRLRAIGAGHSWSPVARPDHTLVDLGHLGAWDRLDRRASRASSGAGLTLAELLKHLEQRGLTLASIPSILDQTLAGATATASHGSSMQTGSLSSLVESMDIVDGRGDLVHIGPDHPDLDAFRAHLGMLGLVVGITLAVVPAHRLERLTASIPVAQIASDLGSLAQSADHVVLSWLPGSEDALVHRLNRTDAFSGPPATWPNLFRRWLHHGVRPLASTLGARVPGIIETTNRLRTQLMIGPNARVGPSWQVQTQPPYRRYQAMEYALPFDEAPRAFTALVRDIRKHRFRIDGIVEIRFSDADSAWMSPAYDRPTVYIQARAERSPDAKAYFEWFESELVGRGGRPHLGMVHGIDAERVSSLWPRAADFREAMLRHDPHGVFRNAWSDRVLGTP